MRKIEKRRLQNVYRDSQRHPVNDWCRCGTCCAFEVGDHYVISPCILSVHFYPVILFGNLYQQTIQMNSQPTQQVNRTSGPILPSRVISSSASPLDELHELAKVQLPVAVVHRRYHLK